MPKLDELAERINERFRQKDVTGLQKVARDINKHSERLGSDGQGRDYKLSNLYEALDHAYIVLSMLPEVSSLISAINSADFMPIADLLRELDGALKSVYNQEEKFYGEFGERADFRNPVRDLGYVTTKHWDDFAGDNPDLSFNNYFFRQRENVENVLKSNIGTTSITWYDYISDKKLEYIKKAVKAFEKVYFDLGNSG